MQTDSIRAGGANRTRRQQAPYVAQPKPYFTATRLLNNLLLIVSLVLVNKFGAPGNFLCYLVLLAMALKNTEGALKALSVSGLIIIASDYFVTLGPPVGYLKYVLLLVAGLTILKAARNPLGQPLLISLLLFGVVVAVLGIINAYYVQISLLKIGLFTYGSFCMLAVARVRKNIASKMVEWTISLILAVTLLSYIALVIGVGFGSFDPIWGGRFTGYRGVFSHPQTMGVIACMFSVYLTALLLFVRVANVRFVVTLLFALLVLVYLSAARTGMYGYVLAVGITLIAVRLVQIPHLVKRLLRKYRRRFVKLLLFTLAGLIALEMITAGFVSDRALEFVKKDPSMEDLAVESLYSSRKPQITSSWDRFQENPLTGIGFGTDLSTDWRREATFLSAPTEKGFMPTALLEEVGIIGTFFFTLFVVSLYSYLTRSRRYLALASVTGLLVVNLGEMMFFSFGGTAMLCWTIIGISMTVVAAPNRSIGRGRLYRESSHLSSNFQTNS